MSTSEVDPRHYVQELLGPDIAEMIADGQTFAARDALLVLLDPEVADILQFLSPAQRAIAFRLLPRERAADVFTFLPPEMQEKLLAELTSEQMSQLMNEMDPDDRVELLDELPGEVVQRLLQLMTPENRAATETILNYPPESVGRSMTPRYLRLKTEWTVQGALDHIRRFGRTVETFDVLYVTDERGRLLHEVPLTELLLAEPSKKVADLAGGNVPSLRATDDQEAAVFAMERYDRPVLPVVDRDNVLVGIVTFDDVADIAEEEVTEDIQKMAAVEALDEPYISVPILKLIRKRALWLGVIFIGQTATISVLAGFQSQLERAAILMLFIPLLISSGGNSGSQASSLIIRALSLGEVRPRDWWRVLRRELACGISLGVMLAALAVFRIALWHGLGWSQPTDHIGLITLTAAVALTTIVVWGTLVGGTLPLALQRAGLDPATSSTPLVSTILDVTGILIYFGTAIVILRGTLL